MSSGYFSEDGVVSTESDHRNAAQALSYTSGYALSRGIESWLRRTSRIPHGTPDSPATIDARDTRDTYRDLTESDACGVTSRKTSVSFDTPPLDRDPDKAYPLSPQRSG